MCTLVKRELELILPGKEDGNALKNRNMKKV